jgi:hypothetical protein
MAAETERELIHERTMDRLAAAAAQGRYGGRPAAVDDDALAIARARRARGESVTSTAAHMKIGRSTLYRALAEQRPRPACGADYPRTRVRTNQPSRAEEYGQGHCPYSSAHGSKSQGSRADDFGI